MLVRPSKVILSKALEDYRKNVSLDPEHPGSLGDLPDTARIDAIIGAILEYLDDRDENMRFPYGN
jgi:hypothetical protein